MRKQPKENELFFSKTLDFLNVYLPTQAGKSKRTSRSYKYALSLFCDYLFEEKGIHPTMFCFTDCTYNLVLEFSQFMQEKKHLAPATVNARITAIKAYLRYASDCNFSLTQVYIKIDRIPSLSVPKKIRPIIEPDDLKDFFEAPPNTKIGNRDRVILILLYDCAVRVSELSSIKLGDILLDVVSPAINIEGKGRKERMIELSDRATKHLKSYIQTYHENDNNPQSPLFYTVIHGEIHPMCARNIERILNKYGKIAHEINPNIPEDIYPHLIRRTKATHLHRDGVPLNVISSFLGHENEETTRLYAIPSPEQLRDATKKESKNEPEEPLPSKDDIAALKKRYGLK